TSCTVVEQIFGIPAMGTMAHSWIQMYDSEYEAFKTYGSVYPDNCTLLVDTYNVLKSGVPNAIKVFKEVVVPLGFRPKGIRIDSGDITYLSKEARKMLDDAGFEDCKIVASNSLDEYIIRDIIIQGAKVDTFGVGERLITSKSEPVFGGVYKLSAVQKDGEWVPKMKLSENISKTTIPGFKQVWRLFDRTTGKAISDLITHHEEVVDDSGAYTIFDPEQTWKQKTIENFIAKPLLIPVFKNGECVYETPTLQEIQAFCMKQIETLWEEALRFENPHGYYVDLSQKLWDCRDRLRKSMSSI
ncbi:MAG: nicotinate phosphoribosyltransferase, partial [Acidaminobacter sp.]